MKIILDKKDIKSIEIEDFTFRDYGGLSAGIVFDVDNDSIEVIDEEDKIKIKIEGSYENEGIHADGRGQFSGKLIIYKDDELFEELEKGRLLADYIDIDFSAGGGDPFTVYSDHGLSFNIFCFIDDERQVFNDYDHSAFNWTEFLNNKELLSKLIPELKKMFPDKSISEDVDNLVNFLEEQEIIDTHEYNPEFNEKYDNTLGKIIFPYFKKEFDGYVFEDDDGGFSISGEPGDEKDGTTINYTYIYI